MKRLGLAKQHKPKPRTLTSHHTVSEKNLAVHLRHNSPGLLFRAPLTSSRAMGLEAQLKPQMNQDTDHWDPLPFEILPDELGAERHEEDGTEKQSREGGLTQVMTLWPSAVNFHCGGISQICRLRKRVTVEVELGLDIPSVDLQENQTPLGIMILLFDRFIYLFILLLLFLMKVKVATGWEVHFRILYPWPQIPVPPGGFPDMPEAALLGADHWASLQGIGAEPQEIIPVRHLNIL